MVSAYYCVALYHIIYLYTHFMCLKSCRMMSCVHVTGNAGIVSTPPESSLHTSQGNEQKFILSTQA